MYLFLVFFMEYLMDYKVIDFFKMDEAEARAIGNLNCVNIVSNSFNHKKLKSLKGLTYSEVLDNRAEIMEDCFIKLHIE